MYRQKEVFKGPRKDPFLVELRFLLKVKPRGEEWLEYIIKKKGGLQSLIVSCLYADSM